MLKLEVFFTNGSKVFNYIVFSVYLLYATYLQVTLHGTTSQYIFIMNVLRAKKWLLFMHNLY